MYRSIIERELKGQNLNKKETQIPIKSTFPKLLCLVLLSQFVSTVTASFLSFFKSLYNFPGGTCP